MFPVIVCLLEAQMVKTPLRSNNCTEAEIIVVKEIIYDVIGRTQFSPAIPWSI
ncbi:hypothetical protein PA05_0714 [Cutibacterium acnes P05]|nr:hypothetical protein [Cutibacterium acnes P05]